MRKWFQNQYPWFKVAVCAISILVHLSTLVSDVVSFWILKLHNFFLPKAISRLMRNINPLTGRISTVLTYNIVLTYKALVIWKYEWVFLLLIIYFEDKFSFKNEFKNKNIITYLLISNNKNIITYLFQIPCL